MILWAWRPELSSTDHEPYVAKAKDLNEQSINTISKLGFESFSSNSIPTANIHVGKEAVYYYELGLTPTLSGVLFPVRLLDESLYTAFKLYKKEGEALTLTA